MCVHQSRTVPGVPPIAQGVEGHRERERERDEKHPNAAVCELGVNVGSLPLLLAYRPLKENSQNG